MSRSHDQRLARLQAELDRRRAIATGTASLWQPFPGPQTRAMQSDADILLYGGAAGGGKTDLLLGLAATQHHRSIIFRREATQLRAIEERSHELFDGVGTYRGDHMQWRFPGARAVTLAGVKDLGDEKKYQGQPHDLKAFDELTHFTQSQFQYLIGWNRSGRPGQRCRVVAGSNPPTDPEGEWVLYFWAPWLDEKHPHPAKPGELRWFTTIGDRDEEVPDARPFVIVDGERRYDFDASAYRPQDIFRPLSRTFIPASVEDNPVYMQSGYVATLQAMPEPLRSKLLFGSFAAGRVDSPNQVIPTAWVQAAQERWKARAKPTTPLSAIGVDVARGGKDKTVLTERYDAWFGEQHVYPGTETPNGPAVLQLIVTLLNGRKAKVNIDVIGVGSSVYDSASDLIGGDAVAMNASEKSEARDKSNKLGFVNKRAEWWWKFREALDPDSGDDVALPPDRELLADLTAPTWRLRMNGIQIESKDDIVARLQRSPDKGESLIYAASVPFIACAGLMNYYAERAATAGKDAQAAPETIRLRVPPGVGGFMVGGSLLQPDAEGTISVSPDQANALLAAGYTRAAQA